MKTIGLYSYKGGTGKSLTAANLAVFLSRAGYNSVIVDADIEGPSVHHKFGHAGWSATGKGGLVSLVASAFKPEAWDSRDLPDFSLSEEIDVQHYAYLLESPRDHMKENFEKKFGSIHILPAGDINSDEYRQIIRSPLWHELFSLYDRRRLGKPKARELYDPFLKYLGQIKEALSSIRKHPESDEVIRPDYMIVDFGSGAAEMSTTLINAWVDTLVYMLLMNDENINHMRGAFGTFADAGTDRYRMNISKDEFYIETVLSRVSHSIQFQGDHTLKRALKARHFDIDRMLVLHSDRDLEMMEELRCGYQTLPQNRRLTHDYLKLFGNLLKEEHYPVDGPEGVAKILNLDSQYEETERVFIHEAPRGTLINPNDKSRNVAFKVETFKRLLEGVQTGLETLLDEERENGKLRATNQDWLTKTLRSAGRGCGEAFGVALNKSFSKGRVGIGVQERIQKWADFDSDVGFGRFCFDELSIKIDGKRLVHCDVFLLESFLTTESEFKAGGVADHQYCEFMTGYIEGVLSNLLGTNMVVNHVNHAFNLPDHIKNELALDPRSESCCFHVSTPIFGPDVDYSATQELNEFKKAFNSKT